MLDLSKYKDRASLDEYAAKEFNPDCGLYEIVLPCNFGEADSLIRPYRRVFDAPHDFVPTKLAIFRLDFKTNIYKFNCIK